LKDSGAEAIFVLENFACTLQKVVANAGQAHRGGQHGRAAGHLKGAIVNLVVRT
jgi:long-chain acyl-CoA synthetase